MLTLSRIAISPLIAYLITIHSFDYALGLLVYAGLTDGLDGFIARRYKLQTALGSILDPLADKFLMTLLTVSLMCADQLPGMSRD